MMGSEIKRFQVQTVSCPHMLVKVTNEDLRFDAEAYHPLMGLWSDMLAYQFPSATGLSGLTQKKSNASINRGFKLCKKGALLVVAPLED
eukprot:3834435-Ditylum_brightwellii.AAC.1